MADIVIEFLRAVDAAADAFGPLKSAVGAALYIADKVRKFKSNQQEWAGLAAHIQSCLTCVLVPENVLDTPEDLKKHMSELQGTLKDIIASIERLQAKKKFKRFAAFLTDPKKITDMRLKFDDAIRVFQLQMMVTSERDIEMILKNLNPASIQPMVTGLLEKFRDAIVHDIAVADIIREAFPIVAGASWDPDRACFPGTRVAVLAEIEEWIHSADATKCAEIFLISDVAGSGKSAIAHAVCERFRSQLVSCFFFARGTRGREDYSALLGHIIGDLATLSKDIHGEIGSILEQDRALLTAGPSRQFDDLVMPLFHLYPKDRPIVIVIDALDEGHNDGDYPERGLLRVLRDKIPRLPGNFRILVTCRPDHRIMPFLEDKPHVLTLKSALSGDAAQHDISVYVTQGLQEMLETRYLSMGTARLQTLTEKSEGLFIWVATILNFLWTCLDPIGQLDRILAEHSPSRRSIESKMDILYQAILDDCNWIDNDFKKGYYLLMGTVLVAKSPLTVSAMKALHKDAVSFENMRRSSLRSLLSGLDANDKPVQILHLSLREFLTLNAPKLYLIDEREHSQRLAQLCIDIMNEELSDDIPGVGYLARFSKEMQTVPEIGPITEQLLYACRFWTSHIVEIDKHVLTTRLIKALDNFATTFLITWMEVVTAKDKFQSLEMIQEWEQKVIPSQRMFFQNMFSDTMGVLTYHMSKLLRSMTLYNDALNARQETVAIYRVLAADQPARFNPNLAVSLINISTSLSDVGQKAEALKYIQEAVTMCRALIADQPTEPSSALAGLALSIESLSNCLSDVGQRAEAVKYIREAVTIYRAMAADQPARFNISLARSLNNLSSYLSDLGQKTEALKHIQEALAIKRTLAVDQKDRFNPDLAHSFNNMATCLFGMGQEAEALKYIQEAVTIFRVLAADQPARFNSNLACSLSNLSKYLSDVGQKTEALKYIQETVTIRRKLAADQPGRFNADLSRSLYHLSYHLNNVGKKAEAIKYVQEALTIYRALAADQPASFNLGLAHSLNSLSSYLSDVGQNAKALKCIQEALTIYRELAADQPDIFNPDLARSFSTFSVILSDVGQDAKALKNIKKAVTLYRAMAVDQPDRFNPDLAESLNIFSNCLSNVDRKAKALKYIQEAVTIYRALAVDQPVRFNSVLVKCLDSLSSCLSDVGSKGEALKYIQEAVIIRKTLAADQPATFN
ncbi:hypothetical protein BV25DRAFT_725140 [Artomyces pyxidatus]|uniref:Uncharacterized protein n=1 Tax=Artomyces pyxidatus TaxID=48021 RepID=A0ACB8T0S8_9AGAM|nr:hypothetical protein BV25DRAFT_725140 [Artomyces pyxidatus]